MIQGKEKKKNVVNQSRQRSWQMLENSGPFRPRVVVKIHFLKSKILPYVHQRQKFQFIKEKGIHRGPLAVGPAFRGSGRKTEKRAATSSTQSHPSPLDSRTQWPAAAFSLAGEGCGEGNFSAEEELLRADCR